MSDFIYTKITAFGNSIEIKTPKNLPDAQHVHTLAYFAAYSELRHREADRVRSFNAYVADLLDKPIKIYSRENPAGLTLGSSYTGDKRNWRPALPIERWKPVKARLVPGKILSNAASHAYVPKTDWNPPSARRTPREAFTEVTFEEI